MKKFEIPEMEIECFDLTDVITTSVGDGGNDCATQLPCFDD